MYNFFSGIGNAISGVYNTVNSWLGVPSAPSQSATALDFNNPVNTQLQAARQNPSIPLPISPGGYTPVPTGGGYSTGGGYAQPAPTSYKSGSNLSFSPAPYTAIPTGGGYATSSYSSSGGASNFGPPPPTPTVNISSLGGGGGTSTTVMPSSPSGTNYYGASVAGNIATGANPQTGLYQTAPTSTTGTETSNAQTSEQDRIDQVKKYINDISGLQQQPASEADAYNRAVQQTGLIQAQQQRLNTQNQINGITAQMNSDLLNLRGVAAKEGVTEAVYGGQQAEVTREATVRLLPLQAQLAADQGNLELAQSNTNTLFKIYADDAKNSADFYNQNVKAAWDLFTADEKKKADELLWQKNYNADVIKDEVSRRNKIANDLWAAGDSVGAQAVMNATKGLPVNMQSPTFAQDYQKNQSEFADVMAKYGGNIGILDRNYKTAQIAKLNADAIKESHANDRSMVSVLDSYGNPILVPTSAAPYVDTSHSGVNYIDASSLQGTASEKKDIIDSAQKAGLKVITNKNSALDIVNIKDAHAKLDTASVLFNEVDQPDALSRDLYGYGLTTLGVLAQTNPKAAVSQSVPIIGLDILKGISGVQGFRGNQTAIQQVQDHLPKATDTKDVVNGKIEFIRKLLNDRENAIVGKSKIGGTTVTAPDGTQVIITD